MDNPAVYPVIRSMYICVRDMERAVAFYEEFLGAPPAERDAIYSVFDLGGFLLGLFAFEKVGEAHTFGSSCLPSIEVASETILMEKIKRVTVVFGPKTIGRFLVAECLDSEGNRLEITAVTEKKDE